MANEVAMTRQGGKSRPVFDIKIIVGGIIILLAVAYLIVAALPSGTAYYITVSELAEMGSQAQTQHTRVSGNVVPGTIVRSAETQDVRFQVEDESGSLTVVYSGVLSDIFGDSVQVVVEGKQGPDGVYYAGTRSLQSARRASRKLRQPTVTTPNPVNGRNCMLACSPECRSKGNDDLTAHPHWLDGRYLCSSAVKWDGQIDAHATLLR